MNLSEKAMLIRLTVSQWTARKKDTTVSNEVQIAHGATNGTIHASKTLIDPAALKTIASVVNEARTYVTSQSLPWDNNGYRILPAKKYMEVADKLREYKNTFETVTRQFITTYLSHIMAAQNNLGSLYDPADYPADIAQFYKFEIDILPMPDADDFRVQLSSDELSEVKRDIQTRSNQRVETAMRDVWDRVHTAVSHMATKLADTDAIFRDSLIGNVADICSLLPALNITDDPELEAMRIQIEDLLLIDINPDTLRKDKTTREQTAAIAQAIVAQTWEYMQ